MNFKFISFLYIAISSTSLTGGENSVRSKTERMTLSKRLGGALSLAMAHNEGFLDKRSSRSGHSSANSSTGGIVGALDWSLDSSVWKCLKMIFVISQTHSSSYNNKCLISHLLTFVFFLVAFNHFLGDTYNIRDKVAMCAGRKMVGWLEAFKPVFLESPQCWHFLSFCAIVTFLLVTAHP